MKELLSGVAGLILLFLFILRREKPWPRNGHGHTYFMGTSRQY
jgi:hypothetical protein